MVNIVSAYAPQAGRSGEKKDAFWGMLDDTTTVTDSEVLLVAGDLNGHIEEDRGGFEDLRGKYGCGVRNGEEERNYVKYLKRVQQRNSVHSEGWKELSANVWETAKEVCVVTTGYRRK